MVQPDIPQMIIRSMCFKWWITKATNTLRIYNAYCFCTAKIVTRTHLLRDTYIGCLVKPSKADIVFTLTTSPRADSHFCVPSSGHTYNAFSHTFSRKLPQRLTQENVASDSSTGFRAYPALAFILRDETNSPSFTARHPTVAIFISVSCLSKTSEQSGFFFSFYPEALYQQIYYLFQT
jgi:hypothetical protein